MPLKRHFHFWQYFLIFSLFNLKVNRVNLALAQDSILPDQVIFDLPKLDMSTKQVMALECKFWRPDNLTSGEFTFTQAMKNNIERERHETQCGSTIAARLDNLVSNTGRFESFVNDLNSRKKEIPEDLYLQSIYQAKQQISFVVLEDLMTIFNNNPCANKLMTGNRTPVPDILQNMGILQHLTRIYTFALSFVDPVSYAEARFKHEKEYLDVFRMRMFIDDPSTLTDIQRYNTKQKAFDKMMYNGFPQNTSPAAGDSKVYTAINGFKYYRDNVAIPWIGFLYNIPNLFKALIQLGFDIHFAFNIFDKNEPTQVWQFFNETCLYYQIAAQIKRVHWLFQNYSSYKEQYQRAYNQSLQAIQNFERTLLKMEKNNFFDKIKIYFQKTLTVYENLAKATNNFSTHKDDLNSWNNQQKTQEIVRVVANFDDINLWLGSADRNLANTTPFLLLKYACFNDGQAGNIVSTDLCLNRMSKNEFITYFQEFKMLLGCQKGDPFKYSKNSEVLRDLQTCFSGDNENTLPGSLTNIMALGAFISSSQKILEDLLNEFQNKILLERNKLKSTKTPKNGYANIYAQYSREYEENIKAKNVLNIIQMIPDQQNISLLDLTWNERNPLWYEKFKKVWSLYFNESLAEIQGLSTRLKSFFSLSKYLLNFFVDNPLLSLGTPALTAVDQFFYPHLSAQSGKNAIETTINDILTFDEQPDSFKRLKNSPEYSTKYQKTLENHFKIINSILENETQDFIEALLTLTNEQKKSTESNKFLKMEKAKTYLQIFNTSFELSKALFTLCESFASMNHWSPGGVPVTIFGSSNDSQNQMIEYCGSIGPGASENPSPDNFMPISDIDTFSNKKISNFVYNKLAYKKEFEEVMEKRKKYLRFLMKRIILRNQNYQNFVLRLHAMSLKNTFLRTLESCGDPKTFSSCVNEPFAPD